LIPEILFTLEKICRVIGDRAKIGRHHHLIVIADGAKAEEGDRYVKRIQEDSVDTMRLGGSGKCRPIRSPTNLASNCGKPYSATSNGEGLRETS
jgi:6-phosphofructokinase